MCRNLAETCRFSWRLASPAPGARVPDRAGDSRQEPFGLSRPHDNVSDESASPSTAAQSIQLGNRRDVPKADQTECCKPCNGQGDGIVASQLWRKRPALRLLTDPIQKEKEHV